ncbi:LysR family transcriptional regulator [Paenibacillus hamazuiensis]|uniref:LysR family transcriptional regulator n=1 Tax=Paenibacillus hamazuiensis TaxID=2936508 RepID=UPI0020103195|nr:LysR family transcriptional regulator [Paenibacillus hamazuiensis]
METRDWLILKVLNDEKNITKTADSLYISQPALTKRLQQIEKEFGVQIVHRGRRGVHFTPQGEYLVKCAEEMLGRMHEIKDHIGNMSDDVVGTLRLGVTNFITRHKLPRILKLFKDMYPKVEFQVTSGWSGDLYNQIYNQEIHVAFIRGDYKWQDQKHLLLEETVCVVSSHSIDLKDLPDLPRIEYKGDAKLKELITSWWTDNYSRPPLIGIEVDKTDTCREMVINGLGYAIMPSLVVEDSKDLYKMNITKKDGSPIKRETWMFYHEEFLELKIVNCFVDFIKSLDFRSSF